MPEPDAPRWARDNEPDDREYDHLEQELEDLLREGFGVVRGDLGLSEEQQRVSDRNAADALARITATPRRPVRATPSAASARPRRRRWLPMAAAAVGTAVAVAAVGIVIDLPGSPHSTAYAVTPPLLQIDGTGSDNYPLTGTNADRDLLRLARLAAAQPPIEGPGNVERITRLGWWLDSGEVAVPNTGEDSPDDDPPSETSGGSGHRRVVPVETETLQLPDGVPRIRVQRGEPLEVGGELEVDQDAPITSDETFTRDAENPLDFPDRLPTQPAALRAALLGPDADCAETEAYCLAESLSMLNLNFVLDPQLEAGLIRTLVGSSDISYAGPGRDRLGRDVDVFVVADPDQHRQYLLLFDTKTGFYAGEETVLTSSQPDLPEVEVPAVIEFAAVTGRSHIDAAEVPE